MPLRMAKMETGHVIIDEITIRCQLPTDLIIDQILTRLPVKSLCRFKCVCKNWLATISTPSFAKSHLKLYSKPSQFIVLNDHLDHQQTFFIPYDDEHDNYEPVKHLLSVGSWKREDSSGLPRIPSHFFPKTLVNSCNGIVCTFRPNMYKVPPCRYFFLWNPSTHERNSIEYPDDVYGLGGYGFGYSSSLDDYKIVACSTYEDDGDGGGDLALRKWHARLDVYSLRSGKWERIDIPKEIDDDVRMERAAVVVDDEFYWARNGLSTFPIFGFDVATKVLERKSWVKSESDRYEFVDLFQMKGCLGLRTGETWDVSHIWMLKKADDWNSWQKLFDIKLRGYIYFSKIGKCLVRRKDEFKLVEFTQEALESTMISTTSEQSQCTGWFNRADGGYEEFQRAVRRAMTDTDDSGGMLQAREHVESLVSPFGWSKSTEDGTRV